MRIIGGIHKGKKIVAPKNLPVRPTTDFAKEGLFNMLSNEFNIDDLTVLDLFAGTGNISFELGSRGAKSITCIDQNYHCISFIKQKSADFDLHQIKAFKNDVFNYLKKYTDKFDLIFADPPYALERIGELPDLIMKTDRLNKSGWLIVEHDRKWDFTNHKNFYKHKSYGNVHFSIFMN